MSLAMFAAAPAWCYPTGVLTDSSLFARTEYRTVSSPVGSKRSYNEFSLFWTALLKESGRTNIRGQYVSGLASFEYDAPDGLVLRGFPFDADILPGDPTETARKLCSALEESGVRVAGAFVSAAEKPVAGAPTGVIYYLTAQHERPDREIRLRFLRFPDPLVRLRGETFDKAGVRVALRLANGGIVYIGRRLGIYVLKADSSDAAVAQVKYYREQIRLGRETYIGTESDVLDTIDGPPLYLTKIFTYR